VSDTVPRALRTWLKRGDFLDRCRYRGKGGEASLSCSRLQHKPIQSPYKTTIMAWPKLLQTLRQVGTICHSPRAHNINNSSSLQFDFLLRSYVSTHCRPPASSLMYLASSIAIALYQGWLQVGYATLYTMAPVFSLVLDQDVNEDLALLYPELYKELTKVSRHLILYQQC
jgi:hypothetical protein